MPKRSKPPAPLGPEVVPADYGHARDSLRALIEAINGKIRKQLGSYSRAGRIHDGTYVKFFMRVCFDDLETEVRTGLVWKWNDFHEPIMELYRKAGWTVEHAKDMSFRTEQSNLTQPLYVLKLPLEPFDELLADAKPLSPSELPDDH